MPRPGSTKNNFTAGEIAPELYGRPDLAAYENGAARLRNVLIRPTGGVMRRFGLRHVAVLPGDADQPARLIAFRFNTEQAYLLVLQANCLRVFSGEAEVALLATPWGADHLHQLSWVQNADTVFLCHPEHPPQRLTRTAATSFTLQPFAFRNDDGLLRIPHFRFALDGITLQPSGIDGAIMLAASGPVFLPEHVGTHFRLQKREVVITAVTSPQQAEAQTQQQLLSTAASADWEEQAFSALRGWPVAVTLAQERLIFAGSRDLPNRVWMSKTGDITNFDLGKGLDDEAIEFALLTDQVDAIRAVAAGRHLQLFTSGAEWMIAGEPLTPAKVRAERQTRVGSFTGRQIPPRHVDGATLFISAGGRDIRQFLYTDMDQAYTADDLSLVAPHLFQGPLDMDYDPLNRLLLVPMEDGSLAVQTNYRAQQILAWTRLETAGGFRAVAVLGSETYLLVARGGSLRLEAADAACSTDACRCAVAATPQTHWGGFDHLEGETLRLRADGVDRGTALVSGGGITLQHPALELEAGLAFTHEIAPLPSGTGLDGAGQARPVRLIRASFRLLETRALEVDLGQGPRPVPFARFGAAGALDAAPMPFTGDRDLRGLGWVRGLERPLWRIIQSTPQPFTLLSVTTDLKGHE